MNYSYWIQNLTSYDKIEGDGIKSDFPKEILFTTVVF